MPTLYSGPLSLYSRKVEIALAEKGLSYERVMVPFTQTAGYAPKNPDVVAFNPKAQVPVFVDDGCAIFDSTVIVEYLDEAHAPPRLLPASPADRARCRMLDLYADEVMIVPLRTLMHRTGPRPADPAAWQAREAAAAAAAPAFLDQYRYVEAKLGDRAFLVGQSLSMADIAVFMALLFGQRLGGPSLAPFPTLLDWYRRLHRRDAFATAAAGLREADAALSAPVDGAYPDAI